MLWKQSWRRLIVCGAGTHAERAKKRVETSLDAAGSSACATQLAVYDPVVLAPIASIINRGEASREEILLHSIGC
jgi:hypothetical protein